MPLFNLHFRAYEAATSEHVSSQTPSPGNSRISETLFDDTERYAALVKLSPRPSIDEHEPPLMRMDSDILSKGQILVNNTSCEDTRPNRKLRMATWTSLPNRTQLVLLLLARLSEPLTQTSLQSYMYHQLQSFSPSSPPSTIAARTGILQGAFTAAQFLTAMWWGRTADRHGRKKVLLIGLAGTCISVIGFGMSGSFWWAVVWRVLGGLGNGNGGVLRTMVSEIVRERKYQSRAFLLLPMCFNIGVIVGPIMGGLLSNPVASYPGFFGEGSFFGGKEGVWWMRRWPYALPNFVAALFLFCSAMFVLFGLEEV
jgi:MFS family permease